MAGAEILHMPVIGADHVGLQRRVVVADQAGPGSRDQEMRVDAFLVHVGNARIRGIVLHAAARLLRAHPHRSAAGVLGARRGLAEDALERDLAKAIDVPPRRAAGRRRRNGHAKLRQFGTTAAKPGIEVFVDHFRRRLDMRVCIPDFEPVLRDPSSRSPLCRKLYTAVRDVDHAFNLSPDRVKS
jgi:hypothetical protein